MAEFKLNYTGSEINQRLAKVDRIDSKADLIGGKVPLEQLPDNIGSGGGASSWNDLQDKPFEEIAPAQTITWDGNTDGLLSTSIDLDMGEGNILTFACYKISDIIVTEELIKGTSFNCTTPDGSLSCKVDIVSEKTSNKSFYATNSQVEIPFIWVVNQDNDSIIYNGDPTFTLTFPETGIWFLKGTVEGSVFMQTSSLTVPAVIKTLDPKYIADMYYDTRIRSYYSQAENPNPPQIDNAMLNMSLYKVSDLVPTRDEIFNDTKVIVNDTEYMFAESGIQLETDDFVFVCETKMMFGFIFVNKSGTLNFNYVVSGSVYPMSIEVPENGEGIYYQRDLNAGVPAGRTIEFIIGGELKQIDPKFIPADLDFNLDDYYTKSEVYAKGEVYTKSEIDNLIGDVNTIIDEIDTLIGA